MQARNRAIILTALAAAFLALAPNALWLARSSALVRNHAPEPVELRLIMDDGTVLMNRLGTLRPGGTRFTWLAPGGEATFSVEIRGAAGWQRHCSEYVEGSMYRVEVIVHTPDDVTCTTSLPIFDRLLISDILS